MDVFALIDLVLGSAPEQRVQVGSVDSVDLPPDGVLALGNVLSDLLDNALAGEGSPDVELSGQQEVGRYRLQVTDRHAKPSPSEVLLLNQALAGSGSEMRGDLGLMAEIARRSGLEVNFELSSGGLVANVVIPTPGLGVPSPVEEPASREGALGRPPFSVFARSPAERDETESFLESVFAPLMQGSQTPQRTAPVMRPEHISSFAAEGMPDSPLVSRVPGANFESEDAKRASAPGESAVNIRSALSDYEKGRERAEDQDSGR